MSRGPKFQRPTMPSLKSGKIDLTKPPEPAPGEIHDPYGVMAKFLADKADQERSALQAEQEREAAKKQHYQETGELLLEEKPEEPKARPFRRKATPATMWVCTSEGEILVTEHKSTGGAQELGEATSHRPGTRWVRVFNANDKGWIYFGPAWVNRWDTPPGEKRPVNMPNAIWLQLTPSERHKVKEREIPKYVKPGEITLDMSQKSPRWQNCKDSRKGKTWDRMRKSQGL